MSTAGKAYLMGTAIDGSSIGLQITQDGTTTPLVTIPVYETDGTAPTISGQPAITGTTEVGETLTAVAAPSSGTAPVATAWQWLRNGTPIAGATAGTYVLVTADDATSISVRQTESNAYGSDTATSAARGIGSSEIEWQLVYMGEQAADNTTADSFTVPVPATLTGDWTLYVMLGSTDTFETLTVNGASASRIVPTPGGDAQIGSANGRMSLFEISVTGLTGSGTLAMATTLLSSDNGYAVTVFAVRGGVLQSQFDDYWVYMDTGGGGGFSGVAVPGDNSLVIGLTSGHEDTHRSQGAETYPQWSNLDLLQSVSATGVVDTQSFAVREMTPAGVYDEGADFNPAAEERVSLAVLVFVPIGAPVPSPQVTQWTVTDEAAVTGDIIRVDVQGNPYLQGSRVSHYEIEIQKAGGTVIERVFGGGANNYVRKHRADQNATTTCRLRPVYQNQTDGTFDRTTAWSDPLDVTTTTGVARVTITASKTTCFTGEAIMIEVEPRGFNTLRSPVAELDFWTTVDVSEHGDLECLGPLYVAEMGQKVRHICRANKWAFAPRSTGTKTFTTSVRDIHGNYAMASIDVTVLDPVATIPAVNIYALSTAGNFTGVPAGANTYTSLAAIKAATPTTGDSLILIDRNETGGDGQYWELTGLGSMYFRPYGAGTGRPELNIGIRGGVGLFSWSGINIKTGYDPSDYPTGVSFRPIDGLNIDLCGVSSVANTNMLGCDIGIRLAKRGRVGIYFDISITDWANFATFGDDAGKYAIFGMSAVQNGSSIRASQKGEQTAPVFCDHGPHRTSRPADDFAICKMIAMANNSWGEPTFVQFPLRLMGSGATPRPLMMHITETVLLMNSLMIGATSRAGGLAANRPQDVCVDSCVMIAGNAPSHTANVKCGLTTIKNTKFVAPGGPRELNPFDPSDTGGSGLRSMVLLEDNHLTPFPQDDNQGNPVRFYNCTFVDMNEDNETGKNNFILFTEDTTPENRFIDFQFIDSVTHAPNYTTSTLTDAPLADDYYGVPHPYQSRFYFDEDNLVVVEETQYGVDNEAMCPWTLEPASAAVGDGSYNVFRDARGTARPVTGASRGWVEPAP